MQYRIVAAALLASAVSAQTAAPGGDNPNAIKMNGEQAVEAGKPVTIEWTPAEDGGNAQFVLLKGPATDLSTVSVLTTFSGNPGKFVWTPSTALANGDDYAYGVVDEKNPINYSGQITLSGGSDEPVETGSATPGSTGTDDSTASETGSPSATETGTEEPSATDSATALPTETITGATTLDTAVETATESVVETETATESIQPAQTAAGNAIRVSFGALFMGVLAAFAL